MSSVVISGVLAHKKGIKLSGSKIIKELDGLHSSLVWMRGQRNPHHLFDKPNPTQAKILHAFGYKVVNGVLQNVN